jgi:hypothetical protein
MTDMTAHPTDPLDMLVDAVLQSYGQLALVVEHMLRSATEASEPGPDILRRRLREVLTPLAERRGDTDVALTAEVLAGVTDVIGAELYLVPIDEFAGAASAPGGSGGSAPRRSPRAVQWFSHRRPAPRSAPP